MPVTIHKSHERGNADYGWLKTAHSFSFADYFNPLRERFGVLRVLNDDIIEGGSGFDTHSHANMEIISIPISGALEHRDSMGNIMVIDENDVQLMSAGSGVKHAEYNHSPDKPCNFLQIWIFPHTKNLTPRYQQLNFRAEGRQNRLQTVVSPNGEDKSLIINQQAWIHLLDAETGQSFDYTSKEEKNVIFIFVIEGEIEVEGLIASRRDSAQIADPTIHFSTKATTRLMLFDIPEN